MTDWQSGQRSGDERLAAGKKLTAGKIVAPNDTTALLEALPEHIDLLEKGIERKLDFSFSGPQSHALPRALASGKIELGAIHTYIELFARYFVDLARHVALSAAFSPRSSCSTA